MEHPSNREIAHVLQELADHSRFAGAFHPARAYRNAAASVARLPVSVGALAMAGKATELRGIGSSIQSGIVEFCETGTIKRLEELREEAPPARLMLTRLPGIGEKTAAAIWNDLRPYSLDQLMEMTDDGRLASVKGVGPVTVDAVRLALQQLESEPEEMAAPLIRSHARRALRDIETIVTNFVDGVLRVHEAGQLARGCELVDVVDVLVVVTDTAAATQQLRELLDQRGWHAHSEHTVEHGDRVTFALDALSGAGVRIHVTDEAHEGEAFLFAIGPPAHAAAVSAAATSDRSTGCPVKSGVSGTRNFTGAPNEHEPPSPDAEMYHRAGLAWIEPEVRHRSTMLDAARAAFERGELLERLVRAEDLRGEMHCHSTWSDGRAPIAKMAATALARGYGHIVITDHSWSLRIAGGLSPADLAAQWRELEEARAELPEHFALLQGTEMEILPDGSLDYDDHILERLDWVVASIHSKQRQDREEITARMERAMRNPYVDCIGHPTSRLLLRRPKTLLDTDRLIELAAETGTFLEINSSPDRLDLDAATARQAADAGVLLCIDSDAHGTETLGLVEHGAAIARRAGLRPAQILNTRSWLEIRELQKRWRA